MKASTKAIHSGFTEELTGATTVPIYQTTAYTYSTAQELADVFSGRAAGYVYSRMGNPTTRALEKRMTELESGIGCIATASGMAAITSVAVGLLQQGDEILAARGIFGGTVSLFKQALSRFGIKTKFVDSGDANQFDLAITDRTRMIFVETISNPRLDIPDISALSAIAGKRGIPLVVDNTVTTPFLIQPGQFGADIVVHSTSKFINGHGTAIGGTIIDTGHYDWTNCPFDDIRALAQKAGQYAFLGYLRNLIYRDLGGCPAPMNSFLMLQGLETLGARMQIHCNNAVRLAEFLRVHPKVEWVNYPGLANNPSNNCVKTYFGGQAGALLTFGSGSKDSAFRLIDALRLARNQAHIGDARTLVVHPASTIFHEFDADQRREMGVCDDMVRVSVGIEDFEDIQQDFEQAIGCL